MSFFRTVSITLIAVFAFGSASAAAPGADKKEGAK